MPQKGFFMKRAPPTKVGPELMEALGLESEGVTALTIRVAVGEPVSVIVEKYVGLDQSEGCINRFKSYELVEKEAVPA